MFGHFGQALRVGVAADQQRRNGLVVVFLVQALDGVDARLVLAQAVSLMISETRSMSCAVCNSSSSTLPAASTR